MSELAEVVFAGDKALIDIGIYYKVQKTKNGTRRFIVLDDEEGKKLFDEQDRAKKEEEEDPSPKPKTKAKIERLNTKWRQDRWKDQNKFVDMSRRTNPNTQQVEIDWNLYRQARINSLLVEWDLEVNGQPIPVSAEMLDKMPPEIILGIYNKFERETSYQPDEEEK